MQASAPLKPRACVLAHLTPLVRVFAMLPQVARWVCALAGSLWSLRLGLGVYAFHVTNQLERPGYTVVRQLSGGVELRAYPEYVVAEAAYRKPPSFKAATTSGFRACASFIFGGNRGARARKMAMTAPVRVEMRGDVSEPRDVRVSFVMASNETLRSLPIPNNAAVKLLRVPAHVAAFTRFAGAPPSEARVMRRRARVLGALAREGVRPLSESETLVYGYHDPFITPNLLRRNEVAVMVNVKGI